MIKLGTIFFVLSILHVAYATNTANVNIAASYIDHIKTTRNTYSDIGWIQHNGTVGDKTRTNDAIKELFYITENVSNMETFYQDQERSFEVKILRRPDLLTEANWNWIFFRELIKQKFLPPSYDQKQSLKYDQLIGTTIQYLLNKFDQKYADKINNAAADIKKYMSGLKLDQWIEQRLKSKSTDILDRPMIAQNNDHRATGKIIIADEMPCKIVVLPAIFPYNSVNFLGWPPNLAVANTFPRLSQNTSKYAQDLFANPKDVAIYYRVDHINQRDWYDTAVTDKTVNGNAQLKPQMQLINNISLKWKRGQDINAAVEVNALTYTKSEQIKQLKMVENSLSTHKAGHTVTVSPNTLDLGFHCDGNNRIVVSKIYYKTVRGGEGDNATKYQGKTVYCAHILLNDETYKWIEGYAAYLTSYREFFTRLPLVQAHIDLQEVLGVQQWMKYFLTGQ